MIKLFSFLCAFLGIFSMTLTNIEVIGGNYGSHFQFILSGNTDELIQSSDNEKIKILIGENEKETVCSIEETQAEQLAYYSCIYSGRVDINSGSQIYLKKDQDNIFGLSENLLIKPKSLTFLSYEVNYLELKDSSLEFNLKATFLLSGNIKFGLIFYLDIKDDNTNKLSECQIVSEENILGSEYYISKCIINDINKNAISEVNITKSSPIQGTVSFYQKLKADINIASFKSINFLSSSDLKFNSNNKWEFNIKLQKSYIKGANALIDIKYNGEESTAFCNTIKKNIFYCIPSKNEQSKSDLVQLNFIKTEKSSLTWANADNVKGKEENIVLHTELTYSHAFNLRQGPNSYWIFDVKISDEDVPNYSKVIVDIYYQYYACSLTCYSGGRYSLATCILNNKILNCETNLNITFNDLVFLKTVKSEDSSVLWKNVTNDPIPIILIANASLDSIYKLFYYSNIDSFNLNLINKLPKGAELMIDIIVNNSYSTVLCKMKDNQNLECPNEKYTSNNTLIYLSKVKTEKSTLTWLNLEKNKIVTLVNLGFIGAYDKKYNDGKYTFKILTYDNYLLDDIEIPVTTRYPYRDSKFTVYYTYYCLTKDDILFCEFNSGDYIELMLFSGDKEDINWINGNNSPAKIYSAIKLTFIQINSFKYNNEEKYFEIEIKIEEEYVNKEFAVIDISIGDMETYAYCDVQDFIMKCKTKKIKNTDDDIYLLINKNLGSVLWKNLENNLLINNLIIISFPKPYDLNLDNGIWKFKIKSNNLLNFSGKKLLDILISGEKALANCEANDYLLNCEVIGDNQANTQLIELNKCYKGNLQLNDINYFFIPLNINLKFIQSSDLFFDNEIKKWSFKIGTSLVGTNIVIPKNSTFTVDILRLDNNQNELAFCSKNNELELGLNTIELLCYTMEEIENDILISLNNIKSDYSSITWTETPNLLDIYMKLELNVELVNKLSFDSKNNKWSFQMIISYIFNVPNNAKIKIDLIYNNEESTATCIFKKEYPYKFICTPDNSLQNENDVFSISLNKKIGTISYTNDAKILIFKKFGKLTFDKAYDLKFEENKWKFKIKLTENNLKIHDSIIIDIYHKGTQSTAYCIMDEDNLLSCESLYNTQSNDDYVCLRYDKKSETVEWQNLEDYEVIYIYYKIKFINVYGGFEILNWKFNIKYEFIEENSSKIYDDKYALIDILVNGKESTAKCYISTYINFLSCDCTHDNQSVNDVVKLIGNKNPNLGTIYFSFALNENQKNIKPFSLSIKDFSIYSHKSSRNLYININGYLSKRLESEMNEGSITELEVLITKLNKTFVKSRAVCTSSNYILYSDINTNVKLYCSVDEEVLDNEIAKINVDNNGYSKYIQFDNFDNNNNRINKNIFLNYTSDNWEKGDTLYNYDDTDEKGYENESQNYSMKVNSGLIYLLIILWFML